MTIESIVREALVGKRIRLIRYCSEPEPAVDIKVEGVYAAHHGGWFYVAGTPVTEGGEGVIAVRLRETEFEVLNDANL